MFSKSVAVKVFVLTALALLIDAGVSHAQPASAQGTVRFNSGSSGGSYGGGYSSPAPAYYGSAGQQSGYQSLFPPEPERDGWQARSDGWYYYWNRNQVIGAFDPEGGHWYAYNQGSWGKASTPPWKRSQ